MRVLLAEDTKDLNIAVTTLFEHQGYQVDSAYDGQEAFDFALDQSYDVIILDIMMPKLDGIEVLKKIRDHNIMTPVLLLTAKSEVDDRVAGLDAGADDYLSKPFAMKELLARIRSLARRNTMDNDTSFFFENIELDRNNLTLRASSSVSVSNREFELLQLLIGHQNGVSVDDILNQVWKNEEADEEAVTLYINYLRRKLSSVGARAEIIFEQNRYKLNGVTYE